MNEPALTWSFFAGCLEEIDPRRPSRIDLGLLEAIMLFPDDEVWRAKLVTSSFVEWVGDDASKFRQESLSMLQQITRSALPISEIHKEIKKERVERGMITGLVLKRLIASPFKSLKEIAAEAMKQVGCSLTPKTFSNEIRPQFRTVPHLWAAYIELAGNDLAFPFPCSKDRFVDFLSAAEFFRLKGESAKISGTNQMFLRNGEAFPLPKNLRVMHKI
jgi:hypothetical protein